MSSADIKMQSDLILRPLFSHAALTARKYWPVQVDPLWRAGLRMRTRSEMNAPE